MSKLIWDAEGTKLYETGVDRGVLFVADSSAQGGYKPGVAWSGLSSVAENPSGGDTTKIYADNITYLELTAKEDFGATIEAYTYPDEFEECDGSRSPAAGMTIGMQARKKFAFAYRTRVGNDQEGDSYGYKLHIIYNCKAAPSSRTYNTVNDSPEANPFSWEITTTEMVVGDDYRPTSYVVIDSTKVNDPVKMAAIEDALWGTESTESRLLKPSDIISILNANAG